jgi:hypothetical protein
MISARYVGLTATFWGDLPVRLSLRREDVQRVPR